MSEQAQKTRGRLAFIDWTRGVAAFVMLQGHTFNSFTRTDLRPGGAYMLSQFVGGLPPAIFLLLTGITFAFLMDTQERKGVSSRQKVWAALKRSRYLFIIAFLFRIQLYVTGYPTSPGSEVLRVDILNCMGFAMLVFAPMAVFTTMERIRLCTILGVIIALLAPVMTQINTSSIPGVVRGYLFPDLNQFGFFPWASFLAFGLAIGSILRKVKEDEIQRVSLWMLGIGVSVATAAHYLSNLPYTVYPKVDFWLDSPALVAIKTGIMLCLLAVAYLWANLAGTERWSFFRQIGTTSLLVYWVHIELVYGRWFGVWKDSLTVSQVVLYTVALTALMTGLSILQTRRQQLSTFFGWRAGRGAIAEPRRAPAE
jgi:uncharacterized membrane protein